MKKVYIEPQTVVLNIEDECALCSGTAPNVGGQITGSEYEDIIDNPIGEGDVPITAKGSGDFFDEPVSSRSLWDDEE